MENIYLVKNVYIKAEVVTPDGKFPIDSTSANKSIGLVNYSKLCDLLNKFYDEFFIANDKYNFSSFTIGFEYFDIKNQSAKCFIQKSLSDECTVKYTVKNMLAF